MWKNVGDVNSGADRLRARQIKEDIKGLRDATEDVKRYADLVVAHNAREKPAPVAFSVISSATDEIVSYIETLYGSSHRDAIDLDNRVLRVRQSLEVIGTGKDRAVRFKAPKTEKSRRDVALTSGAIEVLRSHARQSKLQLHLSGPFCDERLVRCVVCQERQERLVIHPVATLGISRECPYREIRRVRSKRAVGF